MRQTASLPLLVCVLSGALIASTACLAEDSEYNLGVGAYKKKDYAEAAALR